MSPNGIFHRGNIFHSMLTAANYPRYHLLSGDFGLSYATLCGFGAKKALQCELSTEIPISSVFSQLGPFLQRSLSSTCEFTVLAEPVAYATTGRVCTHREGYEEFKYYAT